MSIITIILFFVYTWGLGFAGTYFLKQSTNFFEKNIMRIGIGLGIFPILSIIMNFFHIPLDWKIFLVLSLAMPVWHAIKNKGIDKPDIDFRLTKTNIALILVIVLFAFTFFMYHKGSFIYPWFEDSDPWLHAQGVEYISLEKTAYQPYLDGERYLVYADPYPPSYDIMLGMLHQTSPELMWTMKFFNALIISLGIVFFFYFAKQFTGSANKGVFAAFVLAMVPSYLSHFIWAHALLMTLYFPTLYALERIKEDKRWAILAGVLIGSMLVITPTQAIKFAVFLGIYFVVKSLLSKKLLKGVLISGIIGVVLSLFWWGTMFVKYKSLGAVAGVMEGQDIVAEAAKTGLFERLQGIFNPGSGSATRAYTFTDYFIARGQNMINNPVGLGMIITTLLVLGIIYVVLKHKKLFKEENHWLLISLCLFIFTYLGVNSLSFNLPFGLYAFRFWMLQAVVVSLLCAAGLALLYKLGKSIGVPKAIILLAVIIGVIFTSGIQKYQVNTALWMGPDIVPQEGLQGQGAVWLKSLPSGTAVFSFEDTAFIQSFDKYSCDWCPEIREFRKDIGNKSAQEIHSFLKSNNYEYIYMDFRYAQRAGENKTGEQLKELSESGLFLPGHQASGVIILQVK